MACNLINMNVKSLILSLLPADSACTYLDGVGAVREPLVDPHLELAEEIKSVMLKTRGALQPLLQRH